MTKRPPSRARTSFITWYITWKDVPEACAKKPAT